MKRSLMRKLFSFSLVACMLFMAFAVPVSAENEKKTDGGAVVGYDYPIKPGTSEWNSIINKKERLKRVQIPEDVLSQLSTDELVETVLNYPFLPDMYAYNSIDAGFEAVASNFNGLEELMEREDAASTLLKRYKNEDVLLSVSNTNLREVLDLPNLEVLLGQPQILSKLSQNELEILKEVQKEKNAQKNSGGIYSLSMQYVYTPKGTAEAVFQLGEELSPAVKDALDQYVEDNYPSATVLRTATSNYNCHSYAWYSTSSTNKYWMNDPTAYMTDGSYSLQSIHQTGDRIFYDHNDIQQWHTGIVSTVYNGPPAPGDGWSSLFDVKSKWGNMGLIEHRADDCPYYYDEDELKYYN